MGVLIHAAGILQDAMLGGQTLRGLRAVLASKLGLLQGLQAKLPAVPLEKLVLFSSVASLLGSAGQANYAGANAGLDAWAAQAGSSGMSAISLQWAAWASSGMQLDGRRVRMMQGLTRVCMCVRHCEEGGWAGHKMS